jgi:hypothetical protein
MGKLATKFNYLFKYLVVGVCIAILISSYWNNCNKVIIEGLSKKQKNKVKDKLRNAMESGNIEELRKAIKKGQRKGFKPKLFHDAVKMKRDIEANLTNKIKQAMNNKNIQGIQQRVNKAKSKGLNSPLIGQALALRGKLIRERNRKRQIMSNSIRHFNRRHKRFSSDRIRKGTCDLLYGDHPYGHFSFTKEDSDYEKLKGNYRMSHFIPRCGFYGCSVGGLKDDEIIFEKANNTAKRLGMNRYKGPETFYFLLEEDNSAKTPVKYGKVVQLVSKKTNKSHKCILINPNSDESDEIEESVKYNGNVILKSLENQFEINVVILAAPFSSVVRGMTCGENSDVGNIIVDDQGGISGDNIPSSMRDM